MTSVSEPSKPGDACRYEPVSVSEENTVVAEFSPSLGAATSYQSEAALEAEFIKLLRSQAYEYLPIRNTADLEANLRAQFEALNQIELSDAEWRRLFTETIASANDGIAEETARIQAGDPVDGFDCGFDALTDWLALQALCDEERGDSPAHVSIDADTLRIAGYYSLASWAIGRKQSGGWLLRNAPEPVPRSSTSMPGYAGPPSATTCCSSRFASHQPQQARLTGQVDCRGDLG